MQKYIKNDLSDISYFSDGVEVGHYIDLNNYRLMTKSEILKNELNPHTDYHVWDEELLEWIDSRTPEQITEYERSLLSPLTKYQLNRALLAMPSQTYEDKQAELEAYLASNRLTRIDYDSVAEIQRLDEITIRLAEALGFVPDKMDELWNEALKYS
ncbi:hypothetical protein SKM57_11025 [Acinetobacter faecalis]|uniref:hypothetical protein n=1 Tax=Acinetobacter faecalis TaxID=2665161 RepID=UPI002A911AA3|nr:hypothetical protein [Acinetobacter faecalis]MDY6469111.1 hypothetical protein [Acinetobacter faecalis]